LSVEWCPEILKDVDVPPDNRLFPELSNISGLDEIKEIQSELHYAEILSVRDDIRKVATYHIRNTNLMEDISFITDNDLVFLPILECKPVNGFAHRFYDPEPNQPRDLFVVVAKKFSHARVFRDAFLKNDHSLVGMMLGYPKCCINFFKSTWSHIIDPVWQWAYNSPHKVLGKNRIEVTGYPECNILLRYFGLKTVPHIICSSTCKVSKKLSEKFSKYCPSYDRLIDILSQNMTWDNYRGEAMVFFPGFMGIGNSTPYANRMVIEWHL